MLSQNPLFLHKFGVSMYISDFLLFLQFFRFVCLHFQYSVSLSETGFFVLLIRQQPWRIVPHHLSLQAHAKIKTQLIELLPPVARKAWKIAVKIPIHDAAFSNDQALRRGNASLKNCFLAFGIPLTLHPQTDAGRISQIPATFDTPPNSLIKASASGLVLTFINSYF